jgi:L-malate glycosyltransferase
MPVRVVDAGAFGLLIVATKVGGIPFLLEHNKTSILVEDSNVNQMVTAIRQLIENKDLIATLSKNGRKMAEACDWSVVKENWKQVFMKVLSN